MYNFRYYAIGHSYLKHGPFVGWQTDGFWGMAASAPENDYFHKFQDELRAAFDCKIEAIAENQAAFEGLCTEDATEEKYVSSPLYSHMRELIEGFKPNIITVYIGGGNTPAKDEASLTRFYDVLYGLVASSKRPETVVICPALKPNIYGIAKPVADKYGFITVDMSFIHEKKGRGNPYYAFREYPAYDELRAKGAVQLRTHPNDKGHAAIAAAILRGAEPEIAKIPEGELGEEYFYDKYINKELPAKLKIKTSPEMNVSFFGFNVRQNGECVSFASAPGTGAALYSSGFIANGNGTEFFAELAVDGADVNDVLKIKLKSGEKEKEYDLPLVSGMNTYALKLSGEIGAVDSLHIKRSAAECVITVKQIGFRKEN
jgi:hypothetical protein